VFGFLRFVTFSVTRGLQGLRRNGLMTLAATATMLLMLLLLAGFWLVQAGLAAGVQYVEQKVEIVADLHDVAGAEGSLTAQAVPSPRTSRRCPPSGPSPTSPRKRPWRDSAIGCDSAARWT